MAGSPGSYFAYLKDCLKEWSKKLELNVSCPWHNKNIETETNIYITKFIMNHAFKIKKKKKTAQQQQKQSNNDKSKSKR